MTRNPEPAFIMVVDDDPDIREILRLLLEADGYRVVVACDGQDAWEKIERSHTRPALILLDLMMPRMDGERFLELLRATLDSSVAVIIMSGHGAPASKAAQYGARGAFSKPVDLDDLLDTVHRLVPQEDLGAHSNEGPGESAGTMAPPR